MKAIKMENRASYDNEETCRVMQGWPDVWLSLTFSQRVNEVQAQVVIHADTCSQVSSWVFSIKWTGRTGCLASDILKEVVGKSCSNSSLMRVLKVNNQQTGQSRLNINRNIHKSDRRLQGDKSAASTWAKQTESPESDWWWGRLTCLHHSRNCLTEMRFVWQDLLL